MAIYLLLIIMSMSYVMVNIMNQLMLNNFDIGYHSKLVFSSFEQTTSSVKTVLAVSA